MTICSERGSLHLLLQSFPSVLPHFSPFRKSFTYTHEIVEYYICRVAETSFDVSGEISKRLISRFRSATSADGKVGRRDFRGRGGKLVGRGSGNV